MTSFLMQPSELNAMRFWYVMITLNGPNSVTLLVLYFTLNLSPYFDCFSCNYGMAAPSNSDYNIPGDVNFQKVLPRRHNNMK